MFKCINGNVCSNFLNYFEYSCEPLSYFEYVHMKFLSLVHTEAINIIALEFQNDNFMRLKNGKIYVRLTPEN